MPLKNISGGLENWDSIKCCKHYDLSISWGSRAIPTLIHMFQSKLSITSNLLEFFNPVHGSKIQRNPLYFTIENLTFQTKVGNFFSSSEKIFLLELKKIFFYSFDAEISQLFNGAKISSIRKLRRVWRGFECVNPCILSISRVLLIHPSNCKECCIELIHIIQTHFLLSDFFNSDQHLV